MENTAWKKQSRLSKKKVTLWLEEATYWEIKRDAKLKRISQQMIMEAILVDRFSPDSMADRDALLIRRINLFDRHLRTVEQMQEVVVEAFALFVRMWLIHQPEVPADKKEEAIDRAAVRYEKYVRQLGKNLPEHKGFLRGLPPNFELKKEDFFPPNIDPYAEQKKGESKAG